MIWYIPLEGLDERYTIMMNRQFGRWFIDHKMDNQVSVCHGRMLTDKIESGAFLDAEGTNYYKATQIQLISSLFKAGKIRNGDKFFVSDLWFPGLEAIPYMATIEHINVEIWGIVHAGSFTDSDLVAQMKDWAEHIERGWFKFCKGIFVGSKWIRNDLIEKKRADAHKIYVTGLPFNTKDVLSQVPKIEKEPLIVFPFRFHAEKGAMQWLRMVEVIALRRPDVKFLITGGSKGIADTPEIMIKYEEVKKKVKDRLEWKADMNKAQYFNEISKAKVVVSYALQENFGYGILEAVTLGAYPVLPDRCSYPEIYPKEFIYTDIEDSYRMITKYLDTPPEHASLLKVTSHMDKSLDRMMETML